MSNLNCISAFCSHYSVCELDEEILIFEHDAVLTEANVLILLSSFEVG